MKKFLWVLLCLVGLQAMAQRTVNIIPQPAACQVNEGVFTLTASTPVTWKGKAKSVQPTVNFFLSRIQRATDVQLPQQKYGAKSAIAFVLDNKMPKDESYRLTVQPDGVELRSGSSDGLFWAMQSLLQLCPPQVQGKHDASLRNQGWSLTCVDIQDAPRFAWRGVMFDPCRHFLEMKDLKKQIDVLSQYKINKIHLHLTEDQGWRVEIKRYPKLTEVGSQRQEPEGTITKGYYTQAELKDLVKYAAERHMEVVPELEMPGHELAAIAAYPELSCQGQQVHPRIIWGVEDIVMCPGKEKMFTFLKNVIDELVQIFPSKYFHIGGDESPRKEWKNCSLCQARMKQLGYTREAQLQDYVIDRMGAYLHKKGKDLIGWDEILEGGNLQKSAIVMSWRGEEGGIEAAKKNHRVIMTPSSHALYFDHYQGDHMCQPTCIGGYAPIEKLYAYNPIPKVLDEAGKGAYVMGVQANNWSEYTFNGKQLENKLFPRALALAEIAWTPVARKNFTDFARRLDGDASERLYLQHIDFYITQPNVNGIASNRLTFINDRRVKLSTSRPQHILYSLDGSAPEMPYTQPFVVRQTTTLKTCVKLDCGLRGPVRTITLTKATPQPAVEVKATTPGLLLHVYAGNYRRPYELLGANAVKTVVLPQLNALQKTAWAALKDNHKGNFSAIGEGYFEVPETGVYEFSSLFNRVYIDGELVIDNSKVAQPRDTRENTELALAKGLHEIKVVFLGGIFGGFPTSWNEDKVDIRPAQGQWSKVTQLFHTQPQP